MENQSQSGSVPAMKAGPLHSIQVVSGSDNTKPRNIHLNPKFFGPANHNRPFNVNSAINNQFCSESKSFEPSTQFSSPFPPQHPPYHPIDAIPPFHPHAYEPPTTQWAGAVRPPPVYIHNQPCVPFQSNGDYPPCPPQPHYSPGFNPQPQPHNPWLHPEPGPWLEGWHETPREPEPVPGPSYYNPYNESNDGSLLKCLNVENSSYFDLQSAKESNFNLRTRRSRSRSSYTSSTRSYTRSYSGSRRSRSLSSHYRHSRSRSWSSEFSRSSTDTGRESLYNSEYERNSDSDLDFSKPLSLLSETVSDSKILLKHAFKCLGSKKIKSMMPTECSNYSTRKLFSFFKNILDNTDNQELVSIMEGKDKTVQSQSPASSVASVEIKDSDTPYDESSNSESEQEHKRRSHRKRSKKKKKKRKKNRRQETETEEESQESDKPDDFSQQDQPSTYPSNLLTGSSTSASVTQQSLLELIQIEYKSKAINVMLKNLGVASDITSLVSNALTAGGVDAAQKFATLQSTNFQDCNNIVVQNVGAMSVPVTKNDLPVTQSTAHKCITSHAPENLSETVESIDSTHCDDSTFKLKNNDDFNQNKPMPKQKQNKPCPSDFQSEHLEVDNRAVMWENEAQLLKEMDNNDVLDLGVGVSDSLKLPDDV
ncbi:unnamed protein product [Orchesella dallaii]|uniref:Uncharacterized protein n=1 Tax=Orchesella dallaii TaxID=48710 RepID=A0ABP1R801_9HEXA